MSIFYMAPSNWSISKLIVRVNQLNNTSCVSFGSFVSSRCNQHAPTSSKTDSNLMCSFIADLESDSSRCIQHALRSFKTVSNLQSSFVASSVSGNSRCIQHALRSFKTVSNLQSTLIAGSELDSSRYSVTLNSMKTESEPIESYHCQVRSKLDLSIIGSQKQLSAFGM